MYGSALSNRAVAVSSEYAKAEGPTSAPLLLEIGAQMSGLTDRIRGVGNALERINSGLAGSLPTDGGVAAAPPAPAGAFPRLLAMLADARSLMDMLEGEAKRLSSITGD